MKQFRIAVYPGDGIGPEVISETVRILQRLEDRAGGFKLDLTDIPWGNDFYDKTGSVAPDNFLEILKPFDAIFFGAIGDPARLPDTITLKPLVRIRQEFDQYACVRPARLFEGVKTPLAGKDSSKIDIVVVRENSEGEYVDMGGRFKRGQAEEVAIQVATHSRRGIERILRFGFLLARTRRRRLMMVTKSNAQQFAFTLWEEILAQVSKDFADVESEKQNADAAAMNFVRHPERFDVVVASNLFGDILTDLAGVVSGGLGLAPSANLNPERKFPSLFEPVHGSAPDIAGKGIANPVAAALSAAMMLEWLGLDQAAGLLRNAVATTLAAGCKTADLGGQLNTRQMADEILRRIGA